MYWPYGNYTVNATPTEKWQQHPLIFAMNRIHCTFFLKGCTWYHLHILFKEPFVVIGKADQQVRKASHCGSKQQ